MYRLKLFSNLFGVDDRGPMHPTHEEARKAAQRMLMIHQGRVRIEIHRIIDLRTRKTEKVEEMGRQ